MITGNWSVTYDFNGEIRVIMVKSDFLNGADVIKDLHPAFRTKVTNIEYMGAS